MKIRFFVDYTYESIKEEIEVIRGSLGLSEMNIVGKDNYIKFSTAGYDDPPFNMGDPSNEQAYEFTCLNNGVEMYIQDFREPSSGGIEGKRTKYAGHVLSENIFELGYVQIGLYEKPYHDLIDEYIYGCASYRRIGNNGFLAVTDRNGNIISCSTNAPNIEKIDLNLLPKNTDEEFSIKENDKTSKYYVASTYVEDYHVIAFAEVGEMLQSSEITIFCITLVQIFMFFIVYSIIFIAIRKTVTNRIENIGVGLQNISNGDLDVKINERNSIEMDELSNNINKTVNSLKEYAEKEIKRNEDEMKFASTIQLSALPKQFPINDKFEIYASMNTAKAVGGDFYDLFYIDPTHIAIEIADVSGKGVPAALFMMQAKSVVKNLLEGGSPLEEAANEANKFLCDNNEAKMFVTIWIGVIDLISGHLEYINGGHNHPVIIRNDGDTDFLKVAPGLPFGCYDSFKYKVESLDLKIGDKIYLYTDGVTEAMNKEKQLFGNDRLIYLLRNKQNSNAEEVCKSVLSSVEEYAKGEEQADDITMLCFNFKKPDNSKSIEVDAKIENLYEVIDFVDNLLIEHECSKTNQTQIDIVIDEIFSNICFYAYKPEKNGKVKVRIDFYDDNHVSITFDDTGIPYNPLKKKDLDVNQPLKDRKIGGAGIYLVKKTIDSMDYQNLNGHNVLKIYKTIK